MATRTMIIGFIRCKTMAKFRKGTWKQRILDALVVVKLLPTLKHVINVNNQKSFHRIMNVPESDARVSSFYFLGAGLLMSFHGHSCPSIMIICMYKHCCNS